VLALVLDTDRLVANFGAAVGRGLAAVLDALGKTEPETTVNGTGISVVARFGVAAHINKKKKEQRAEKKEQAPDARDARDETTKTILSVHL